MTDDEAEQARTRRLRAVSRPNELSTLERIDERTLNTLTQLELVIGHQKTISATQADHAKALRVLVRQQAAMRRDVKWFTTGHVAAYAVVSAAALIAALCFVAITARRLGWI